MMKRDLEGKVRKNPASRLFAPLADVYRKNGKIEEAVALLERGLVQHPGYESARVLLARCYEDLGEWDRAREAWRSVLELDPDSLVALRGMGEIAVWTGDPEEAAGWFRRYLEEFPGDERIRERLIEVEAGIPGGVDGRPEGGEGPDPESEVERVIPEPEVVREEPAPVPVGGFGPTGPAGEGPRVEAPAPADTVPGAEIDSGEPAGDGAGGEGRVEIPSDGGETGGEEAAGVGGGAREAAETALARSGPGASAGGSFAVRDSLETMTLAEIYAQQGFYERAIEIYRRIERQEPGNGRIRDRIAALEARLSPGPGSGLDGGGDEAVPPADAAPTRTEDDGREDRGAAVPDAPIRVNAAGSSELESIPGVGPVIARKIVVERERNGPFAGVRDLRRVPSLGRRLIEKIEPYLSFDAILREAGESVGAGGAGPATVDGPAGSAAPDAELPPDDPCADPVPGVSPEEEAEFEEFKRWLKNLRK